MREEIEIALEILKVLPLEHNNSDGGQIWNLWPMSWF
jgi:hypothetical protein